MYGGRSAPAEVHIAGQFLTEAAFLACLGGIAGVAIGSAVTAVYARSQGWLVDVPVSALAAGAATSLAVGVLAGASPAIRAARLDPAEALRRADRDHHATSDTVP